MLAGVLSAPGAGAFGAIWALHTGEHGFYLENEITGVIDDDNAETPEQAVRRAGEVCAAAAASSRRACKIYAYVNACGAAATLDLGLPKIWGFAVSAPGENTEKDAKAARHAVRQKIAAVCRREHRGNAACEKIPTLYVHSKCDTTEREDFDWGRQTYYNWVVRFGTGNYENAAASCPKHKPVLGGGKCRARKASDCRGKTPVFDGGECRAQVASDCRGKTPVFDGEKCRARIAADCTGDTPVFDDGECLAPNASLERCLAGTKEPRRIFRKPGALKITGHEFPGLDKYAPNDSIFNNRTFTMSGNRLADFYRDLENNIQLLNGVADVGSEAHRRIWLRADGKWIKSVGRERTGRDSYTPYYQVGGKPRTLRAGDVVSVLTTTDELLKNYAAAREVAVFRLYTNPSNPGDILMAVGEKPAEKSCTVSDGGFFLTDDFTPTDDFEAAGSSFEILR